MEKADIMPSGNRHFANSNNVHSMSMNVGNRSDQSSPIEYDKYVFKMGDLLQQSLTTLNYFVRQEHNAQRIPHQLLQYSKGLIFLRLMKGAIGIGGMVGIGVLMKHNIKTNEWYGPCALNMNGISIGLEIGFEQIDSILIINDENIFPLLLQGNIIIGSDIAITMGTFGDDHNISLSVPNLISYSISKGAFMGIGLEGTRMTIYNECNDQYYLQHVNPVELLNGSVRTTLPDIKYVELCQTLNDYIFNYNNNTTNLGRIETNKFQPEIELVKYQFNENIPLYQFYSFGNVNNFSKQQLSQLPFLPFLKDIRNKNYTLINTRGWVLGKKIYNQVKNFFTSPFQKHDNELKMDDNNNNEKYMNGKKFFFNENIPLFQYYMRDHHIINNDNNKFMSYDYKQLSGLPKLPFLNNVHHYKFHMAFHKLNPMNITKRMFGSSHVSIHDHHARRILSIHKKHDENTKYIFNELLPLFQYYNHNENINEIKYNFEILNCLPRFPFLNDIRNNKFHLRKYNPIHIVKNQMNKHHQKRKNDHLQTMLLANDNIPFVQYYVYNNVNINYDHKQLSSLPKLPFLHDIKNNTFHLRKYNPIVVIKSFYKQIKNQF